MLVELIELIELPMRLSGVFHLTILKDYKRTKKPYCPLKLMRFSFAATSWSPFGRNDLLFRALGEGGISF